MNTSTTLLFYLLLGGAIAVADYLAADAPSTGQRWFRSLTALLFWPLYLPALLQRSAVRHADAPEGSQKRSPRAESAQVDDLSQAISQVEAELDLALASLGSWSDAVLAREQHRFAELRAAWHAQADRIRELDTLLRSMGPSQGDVSTGAAATSERVTACYRARQANIDRLQALRDRYHTDLMNTLAWVRELVTMIHLARYTGAPASRAEELVMQIAMSVEGISEVAGWREGECVTAGTDAAPGQNPGDT